MGIVTISSLCLNTSSSQIPKQYVNELLLLFWLQVYKSPNILSQTYPKNQLQAIQQKFNSICHLSSEKAALSLPSHQNIHICYQFDSLLFAGPIRNGYLQGRAIVVFADWKAYIGEFKEGRFSGRGQFKFINSLRDEKDQLRIQTFREQNIIHLTIQPEPSGAHIRTSFPLAHLYERQCKYVRYKNGDEYVGEWKDGMPHGEGKYYYKNGHQHALFPCYAGSFVRGQREGRGTLHYDSSKCLRITWSEGRPCGQGELKVSGYLERVFFNKGQRVYQKLSEIGTF